MKSGGRKAAMDKPIYTVLKEARTTMEEKRSIFICSIKRITSEQEAMEFISSIKSQYKDATHNVYAYITNNGISMRYSDDGEPQGTAGPPMLEVLKREGINDVAAVVTRYFGGTLLGAGGLIRAYSSSCKQGLDEAVKVRTENGLVFNMSFDYDMYGRINNYLKSKNIIIKETIYLEKITLEGICPEKDLGSIDQDMREMFNGEQCLSIKSSVTCFMDDEGMIMEV
jgi:uncharacterized YigZ family protein